MIVFTIGGHMREIDELDQNAAVAAGRESCGIRKCGHWLTSHRSCGSMFRSRHIFAGRSRPISFFRSLEGGEFFAEVQAPVTTLPLSPTNSQAIFLRRANRCTRRSNSAPFTDSVSDTYVRTSSGKGRHK